MNVIDRYYAENLVEKQFPPFKREREFIQVVIATFRTMNSYSSILSTHRKFVLEKLIEPDWNTSHV